MPTSLEHRLRRLEHGRPQPMIAIIVSFTGVIDNPMTISLSGSSQRWVRRRGESACAFRQRAVSGTDDVGGGAAVVVLRERNATGSDTLTQARRERGSR